MFHNIIHQWTLNLKSIECARTLTVWLGYSRSLNASKLLSLGSPFVMRSNVGTRLTSRVIKIEVINMLLPLGGVVVAMNFAIK